MGLMSVFSKPWGEIRGLGRQAYVYARPAMTKMALGAGAGAAGGFAAYDNGSEGAMKGAALGALGGLAWGKGLGRAFMRGGEVGGVAGGLSRARATMGRGWSHAASVPRSFSYDSGFWKAAAKAKK